MPESSYRLSLSPPVFLVIELGSTEVKIDVFEAQRLLAEAEKQPSPDARWKVVKKYLAEKLGIDVAILGDNNAAEFHNAVIKLYNQTWDSISKKVEGIACSQQPTPESQPTT